MNADVAGRAIALFEGRGQLDRLEMRTLMPRVRASTGRRSA